MNQKCLRALAAVFAALLSVSHIAAAQEREAISPSQCVSLPNSWAPVLSRIVGPNWAHYRPFMKLCAVKNSAGIDVLNILALEDDDAANAGQLLWKNGKPFDPTFDTGPADPVPMPKIFNTHGALLGTLPINIFYVDPRLQKITFTDWRHGFPYKIEFYAEDPTAGAPQSPYCPPPMIWHPETHQYIQTKGDFYGNCAGSA